MKANLGKAAWALVLAVAFPMGLRAQTAKQFSITTETNAAGFQIPSDFLGLSFETADTLPKADGSYPYFRSDNTALVNLFRTIGVKSLRIGGNTADRPSVAVPNERDIDELFSFAKAADVKVIYTLRMRDWSPEKDAPLAKYLENHYAAQLSCLVIGNEADIYEKQYPKYHDDEQRFLAAVFARGVAPNAKICGPSTAGNPQWSANFVRDFGPSGHVLWVTQHMYAGGNGKKVTEADAAAQRARILSPDFAERYKKLEEAFVPAVEAAHMQYRMEETNSFYNGGAKDVSNTFASSLWALNYLYWWAEHGSQGVNFHTGDFVAAGPVQTVCWYGTFHTMPDGKYQIRPIAYAMKAFHLGSDGALVPVSGLPAESTLHAYAVVNHDAHTLYVTLVNAGKEDAVITVNPGTKYSSAETMALTAPGDNIAATEGVRLGGGAISADGLWNGKWSREELRHGRLRVAVPADSALVVKATE